MLCSVLLVRIDKLNELTAAVEDEQILWMQFFMSLLILEQIQNIHTYA